MQISRSQIKWFKHNDMEDLEHVLQDLKAENLRKKKPLSRQFIVVEGIYANCGDICPLVELIELKKKYKYRLIVEESMSIGVLGPSGAGVCDHFGISVFLLNYLG
jgi:serine palmitoyltransferase